MTYKVRVNRDDSEECHKHIRGLRHGVGGGRERGSLGPCLLHAGIRAKYKGIRNKKATPPTSGGASGDRMSTLLYGSRCLIGTQ